jgi:D-alanyl-D-alanine carboxypeptidase
MRRLSIAILLFPWFTLCSSPVQTSIYGPVPREEYLLGRFDPTKHPLFVRVAESGVPIRGVDHRLRKETMEALAALHRQLKKDHPAAEFWVQSATRTWYDQRAIWEGKWFGRQLVEGKPLNTSIPDPLRRARKILEFSSMPGTSRHHWGTDFDINVLTNVYYDSGNGKTVYEWMKKNAKNFGFCQVYTAGRKAGYFEERWHWSYVPLSRQMTADWIALYGNDNKRIAEFEGAKQAGHLARTYVESINSECLK